MGKNRLLFWHRRDLRINDNKGLSLAASSSKSITGIYILDPAIIECKEGPLAMAESKIWFLAKSLLELQKSWEAIGSRLLIIKGNPIKKIPYLAKILEIDAIYANKNIEPYETFRDERIKKSLAEININFHLNLDHLLVNPQEIKTLNQSYYKVYSPFLRKWNSIIDLKKDQEGLISTYSSNYKFDDLNESELISLTNGKCEASQEKNKEVIKFLIKDNDFNNLKKCPCIPGEKGARKQMLIFTVDGHINKYKQERDYPFKSSTSFLSAALSLGTISCREVYNNAISARKFIYNKSDFDSIETWIKELVWREFYQNALLNFPELQKGPYQKKWKNFPWQNNLEWFKAWKDGLTGVPIIDAAMRELNQTGWMHNRCRMIVASFLVKDLITDWKYGEEYFMQNLVDGDLAANNGGWQWSASSGMDTKPLRIFNPYTQTSKFDRNAEYIRQWIPEISHIANSDLITGDIPPLERANYPTAIINHKEQQATFKQIYSSI